MTPEQQRIAIAEACPDVFRINDLGTVLRKNGVGEWVYCDPLHDLNAMHEAERIVLGYDEVQKYKRVLNKVCGPETHPIFSDAAQRAEAFLRTLNLWKD